MKLMFRMLLVILAVSIANSCKNEAKVENEVIDLRIYDLMNQVLKDQGNKFNLILDSFYSPWQRELNEDDSSNLVFYDTIFSKDDISHMIKDSKRFLELKLTQNHFSQRVINSDSIYKQVLLRKRESTKFWNWFREEYNEEGFCAVSWPVLSKNKQYAVIKYGYSCGSLCGYRVNLIYKYERGNWYLVAKYDETAA